MKKNNHFATSDRTIRVAIKAKLERDLDAEYGRCPNVKIIEELGITHGAARVDIAVVNGVIHGYELKSDRDTLERLPEQIRFYNAVLDRVTLVVGKRHLVSALELIPEWWGITVAKVASSGHGILLYNIREARENLEQDAASVAALLWREEALDLLEDIGHANGVRSKSRRVIYERLAKVLDQTILREKVRERLCLRSDWRSDVQCMLSGG